MFLSPIRPRTIAARENQKGDAIRGMKEHFALMICLAKCSGTARRVACKMTSLMNQYHVAISIRSPTT